MQPPLKRGRQRRPLTSPRAPKIKARSLDIDLKDRDGLNPGDPRLRDDVVGARRSRPREQGERDQRCIERCAHHNARSRLMLWRTP